MAQITYSRHGTASLWQRLTVPHPSITDIEQRRQSRLLAGIMIVLGATTSLASVILTYRALVTHNSLATPLSVIPTVISLTILYFLNRSGRYRLSAYLFVAQTFLVVHIFPLFTADLSWLLFASMLVILSAILLPWRAVLIVFGASVAAQIGITLVAPGQTSMSNLGIMIVFFITAPVMMVFMSHRDELERERQQELRTANEKLRESETSLERRVTDRTRDLHVAADVSRQITTILDLNELLQAVVESTKVGFGLYHVSAFLYNAELQALDLEAGAGQAGVAMKAEGWRFKVSTDQGLVPESARKRAGMLVNNVLAEPRYMANPHLPNTRAEMAVPMIVGAKLVGVLDIQSEQANRFTQDDLRVMTTLAEQIAIAVNNARLYAEQVQVAERLREVDNMKSSFLASMSHELRTPLNAILNFTKFVSSGMLGEVNDKQKDALNKTIDSGRHLLSLINDVLDITKIESKMLTLFVELDVNLREELDTVLASAESLVAEKPVKLIRDIDPELPILVGDKRRIRQIMLNLVSNACKFTESGSITVGAHVQDQLVQLFVKDTGPGIALEDQDLVFEAFRQTRAGLGQGGGTGLGLAIAKRLAEAHGGQLWLESTPGQGATFYVTLPVQSEALRQMITVTAGA